MSSQEFPYRFYYHALKPHEKKAYEAYYDGLRHMEKEIVLPKEKGKDLNFMRATVAVKYDHPELDFLSENSSRFLNYDDKVIVYPNYVYSKEEVAEAIERMSYYIKDNFADLRKVNSPYLRILTAHDRIARTIKYDLQAQAKKDDVYRIDGPILTGKGVCLGIAKLFMMVLNYLNIKNHVIFGDALYNGGLHAWNVVYFGNEAYHIDLTWDLKNEWGHVLHRYFMVNNKLISKTHAFHPDFMIPDGRFEVLYPFYRKTAFHKAQDAINFVTNTPFKKEAAWEILLSTKDFTHDNLEEIRRAAWWKNPTTKNLKLTSMTFDELQTIAIFVDLR